MAPAAVNSHHGSALNGLSATAYGHLAEQRAILKLSELGHKVAVPVFDDDGVDLVVNYSVKVQVKASARTTLETVPGFVYRAYTFSNKKRDWPADIYLLYGGDGDEWFVVPADLLRGRIQGSITFYRDGRRGISPLIAEYREAWHLFDG